MSQTTIKNHKNLQLLFQTIINSFRRKIKELILNIEVINNVLIKFIIHYI